MKPEQHAAYVSGIAYAHNSPDSQSVGRAAGRYGLYAEDFAAGFYAELERCKAIGVNPLEVRF